MNLRTSSPIPRPSSLRRGSALLFVLGMLAFLVVSAVAFSAFMRHSRLPSSFLLRMSSSRQLVKAALAESLDELDRAIGNNPHPGVGTEAGKDPNDPNKTIPNRNQWRNRVFLGTNMTVAVGETVSTLTLEGLAYVPAPLINEVRYYSRRSPAAVWHTLGFDSGRFAFTAVDVSDYFDVNRMMAAPANDFGRGGRTSAADGRVALAYLFEDTGHTGWRTRPDAWDEFMDTYLGTDPSSGSSVPFVSVADLNLAVWDKKPAGVLSPWCRFIENGTEFVQDNAAERQALSNLVFVTDSWYPSGKDDADALDLASGANQPFYGLPIGDRTSYPNRGVDDLARNNPAFMRKFADNISLPELVQLCDYLDADSVPTTLAMPTTERVPMVIGASLAAGSTLTLTMAKTTRDITKPGAQNAPSRRFVVTRYSLKLAGELRPMVAAVYPFKHSRGADDTETFSAQVAATLTLVPAGSEARLRRRNAVAPAILARNDWNASAQNPTPQAYNGAGNVKSVAVMRSAVQQLALKRNPANVRDCIIDAPMSFGGKVELDLTSKMEPSQYDDSDRNDVCTLRVVQEVDPDSGQAIGNPEVTKGWLPSNADLSGTFAQKPDQIGDEKFVPVIQFWIRIVNSAGDTVDLVPACAADDVRPSTLVQGDNVRSAFERPLLRFHDSDAVVQFTEAGMQAFANSRDIVLSPKAYVADDPRFNHAPEDLNAVQDLTDIVQEYWLANNTAPRIAGDDEPDVFMETSDAGYLQSKFELAYLLNITGLFGNDMWGVLNSGDYDGAEHAGFASTAAKKGGAMWRTYSPYDANGRTADRIDDLKMVSGRNGACVCPYTPDTAVMMGALANTPRDWWAASTNGSASAKQTMLSKVDEALKYTFSDHAQDASTRVRYRDMEALAKKFIDKFHESTSVNGWRGLYDGLAWDGALFDDLEDGSDVALDTVDRKYLYGFWRECFDARQQLFLVFVRAEPMMMGGGVDGYMPPMLGARAVALVWRDPTPTKNNAPHRMRVLFYRQFD